jgi:hypothetical protein
MWRNLTKAVGELQRSFEVGGSYRADLHYMRGPGPKWRAKYGNLAPKTIPISSSPGSQAWLLAPTASKKTSAVFDRT